MSLKEEWVAALRSGEYHQIDGRLRDLYFDADQESPDGVGYCCMGVLCDVVDQGAWKYMTWYGQDTEPPFELLQEVFQVPEAVFESDEEDPAAILSTTLVQMNDGEGLSFDEIADWIEAW